MVKGLDKLNEFRSRQSMSVLLLEKSRLLFDVIRTFLAHAGFNNIFRCADLAEAMQLLDNHNINLVIADSDDQHASGTDLLRQVREIKQFSDIPFVIVSGQSNIEAVNEVMQFDHVEYLVKPFNEQLFKSKLEAVLSKTKSVAQRKRARKGFESKLLVCAKQRYKFGSDEEMPEILPVKTVKDAVQCVSREKECDIVVLDEQYAQAEPDATRKLLEYKGMGQVELVLLLDDMADAHVQNLNRLGIEYLIEKSRAVFYLNQLIPLLITTKQSLLNTNTMVRQLEFKEADDDTLHSSVLNQIKSASQQIQDNSQQILSQSGGSSFLGELASDSSYNAECIGFWADAVVSTQNNVNITGDKLYLTRTLESADRLFTKLLNERKLQLVSDIPLDFSICTNSVLFNSLFMFLLQALMREVSYQSIITISVVEEEDVAAIKLYARIQHLPRFHSIASAVTLTDSARLQVAWSEPIARLIARCHLQIFVCFEKSGEKLEITLK